MLYTRKLILYPSCHLAAAFIALFFSIGVAQAQEAPDIIGEAQSLKTGQLLYRELHYLDGERPASRRVDYRDSRGELIARKNLVYAGRAHQPDLEQTNQRCGEEISVTSISVSDKIKVRYLECGASKAQSKILELSEWLVVDAGFDALIQQHWQELAAGGTLDFEFLAPSRLGTLNFELNKAACEQGGEVCFRIEAQAWWLRWVLEPIQLRYEPNSQRLLRYTGLGNVADSSGAYPAVDIIYSYP